MRTSKRPFRVVLKRPFLAVSEKVRQALHPGFSRGYCSRQYCSIGDSIAYAAVLRVLLNQGDIFIVDNFFDGAHGAHFAAHGAAVLVLGC